MACVLTVDDEILAVKTSGALEPSERQKVLKQIVSIYDNSSARAIIVDHRDSNIICSKQEAIDFGVMIDFMFSDRWPCFIAVLVDEQSETLELIDLSVFRANAGSSEIDIRTFHDEEQARKAVAVWREEHGGGGDIAVLP